MKLFIKTILTVMTLVSVTYLVADTDTPSKLEQVIAAEHRADSSKRDQYRHPLQTLNFFQVQEGHSVIEIWPGGGGWYTEILAPFLRDKGSFSAAQFNPATEDAYPQKVLKKYNKKLQANPELYDKVNMVVFNPIDDIKLGAAGTADRVLTFRNLHNWSRHKDEGMIAIFKTFHQVLKPGGMLGITEHRLPEDRDGTSAGGYVKQSYAIKMAEAAGFKLVDSSEINANAKDTADHPKGVWTLPPTLALKDQDREKYLAIGESDRMTLLFIKQ